MKKLLLIVILLQELRLLQNTVYFYEVRPIIDSELLATTGESYNKVRIISPPNNMSFVHRWIANKNICDLMHSEDRDDLDSDEADEWKNQGASEHYVCKYHGVGAIPKDLLNANLGDDMVYDLDTIFSSILLKLVVITVLQTAHSVKRQMIHVLVTESLMIMWPEIILVLAIFTTIDRLGIVIIMTVQIGRPFLKVILESM